jgi:hypothetical protein
MAESVKRRVAAARLAVAFVAAGTIAGATAWAQAGPPPTAQSSASDIFAKLGDIKSQQIENHSLKYIDFAKGQVPSFDQFKKLDQSFGKYKKANAHDISVIKGELGGVNGDISAIKGELGGYIKTTDADARYIKMNEAILGDGSVFTAHQAIPQGGGFETLLDLPNTIKVEMSSTELQVTNTSGGPLSFSACTGGAGGGTIDPGKTTQCSTTGGAAQAMQFVNGDGKVMTLNFSNLSIPGAGGSQGTVQILVGL